MTGSGNIETAKRDVADFDRLEVSGVFDVEVTRGDAYSVEVTADDNILPLIRTEVDDRTLSIFADAKISKSSKLRVVITAPNIEYAETSGVSKLVLNDVSNESLSLRASGASSITASGTTGSLSVDISGASKAESSKLSAKRATVETSGASNACINATDALDAHASGASHIKYIGSPGSLEMDRSGAATISQQSAN
ncbi:MAG: hypothetical protein UZ17_ACD001001790 [Acidobacteria bacterium OLB17]|nr:MAG: hypothetical protein UZ17_ACD001001790 [Acidobacteria bacterium OLB17]